MRYLLIVFCLQESHLSNIHEVDIQGYTCYRANVNDGLEAHGSVAILVQNCIHSRIVPLNIQLQSQLRYFYPHAHLPFAIYAFLLVNLSL
jgi:hypothetical protein